MHRALKRLLTSFAAGRLLPHCGERMVLTHSSNESFQGSVKTMHLLALCAQGIIACAIAFVWIVRLPQVSAEFHEYGLSDLVRTLVGAAKIVLATLLVVAIWYPALALIPALLMACLMVCAVVAHVKVHHAWRKSVPAGLLLVLSLFVAYVYARPINL